MRLWTFVIHEFPYVGYQNITKAWVSIMYNLATNLHSNSKFSYLSHWEEGRKFFCLNSQLMSLFGYQTIISDCLSGPRLCGGSQKIIIWFDFVLFCFGFLWIFINTRSSKLECAYCFRLTFSKIKLCFEKVFVIGVELVQ